jgi:hypothetical protein
MHLSINNLIMMAQGVSMWAENSSAQGDQVSLLLPVLTEGRQA